jgi:hypothetical protein
MKDRRLIVIVAGLLFVGLGLFIGFRSHQVSYRSVAMSTVMHYLSDANRNLGYLQLDSTSSMLFLVEEESFHPAIQGIATLQDGMLVSLIYRTDQTTAVDAVSFMNTHLVGDAYTVVELTLYDDIGRVKQQFVTDTYSEHPQGFYENDWLLGGLGILVGVLAMALSPLLKPRRAPAHPTMPAGPLWPPSAAGGTDWRSPSG